MLQLNIEHTNAETTAALMQLEPYTARLRQIRHHDAYTEYESSIKLPDDKALLEQAEVLASQKGTRELKYSIVVGIGGSNLGTKAVYDALFGARDVVEPQRFPKMLFAETTDPEWLAAVQQLIGTLDMPEEILVTVISKSGGTTETLANFEVIMKALHAKFPKANDRVIAITDEGSKLWQAAAAQHIARLSIPAPVGGRYSVLSAVGLVPLASVGIDIARLSEGASKMLNRILEQDNIAALSAAVLADAYAQGYVINDNFFFHPELESLGKWYRQLMGESIGKEQSLQGETVYTGITPTVSLGSTDLHSVGQLYLGGPKNKLTTFVSVQTTPLVRVPHKRVFPELVPMVTEKSTGDILKAILEGTKIAYEKAELPFMEVVLDKIDEYSLGAYLQFKMVEMMYLGQLLDVNSFDQPNVESYKVETKHLLENA